MACEKVDLESSALAPESSPYEVSIRASHSTNSRTEMMPNSGNEQPIKWSKDDRIALWAKSTTANSSNYTLDKVEFWLRTYNHSYNDADFVSILSTPMNPDERYRYYAVYPAPASQSNDPQKPASRYVSFNLPNEQSGVYNPNLDVMVASTDGCALVNRGDYPNNLGPELEPTLQFSHLFHLIRIRIPENENNLGHPVKKLEITFPQNVVGNVSFDVTNVEETISLTNAKNKVTINLDGDIDAGRGYVWLHIMPTELNGDVTIAAYSDSGVKSKDKTFHIERNLQAGHITPISFAVPRPYRPIVNISLEETFSFLGEPWNTMTLTGFKFVNLTTMEEMSSVTITPDNKFIAIYPDVDSDNRALMESVRGKMLVVTYDSEHALLTNRTIALPSDLQATSEYNTLENNTVYYKVPYLFEENFEKVEGHQHFQSIDHGGGIEVTTAVWLSDCGVTSLAGWSGAKWYTSAGKHIVTGTYISSSWIDSSATKTGRVDTNALQLKNDLKSKVTVTISYDVKGWDKADYGKSGCVFGTTTQEGKINGKKSWEDPSNPDQIRLDIENEDILELDDTSDEPQKYYSRTHILDNCDSKTRLTWCCRFISTSWQVVSEKNFYMAIDNIKVSIGSEVKMEKQ